MNTSSKTLACLALAALLPLTACSQDSGVQQAVQQTNKEIDQGKIAAEIQQEMDKAKQELQTQNIDINGIGIHGTINGHAIGTENDSSLPKAEITPQGDLLIDGKKIDATPQQHALLLDYRQKIIAIASAGMDIGAQGAQIGISAAKEAITGLFGGKDDKAIEAAIKPQTDKIEAQARQLCGYMPGVMDTQQKLAASLPAFKPYATMKQKDVDDCFKDETDANGKHGHTLISF